MRSKGKREKHRRAEVEWRDNTRPRRGGGPGYAGQAPDTLLSLSHQVMEASFGEESFQLREQLLADTMLKPVWEVYGKGARSGRGGEGMLSSPLGLSNPPSAAPVEISCHASLTHPLCKQT